VQIEPRSTVLLTNMADDTTLDLRAARLVAAGFHPLALRTVAVSQVPGWTLTAERGRLDLRDGEGSVVLATSLRLPDAWRDAADLTGHVLVLTGPAMHVRHGLRFRRPPDAQVADQFRRARQLGGILAGAVVWTPA
jgi:hypothetical protein